MHPVFAGRTGCKGYGVVRLLRSQMAFIMCVFCYYFFFDIFNVVFLVNGYFVLPSSVQAGRGVIDERK